MQATQKHLAFVKTEENGESEVPSRDTSGVSSPAPSTRVTERIRVDVEIDSESHFFAGLGGNVAKDGGIFAATHRNLRTGQTVLVEIRIDEEKIIVIGTVRWRTSGGAELPAGAGLTFDELSEPDQRRIERFCARRPPFYFDVEERLAAT